MSSGLPAQQAGSLTAPWQPLGPASVESARYGKVSGRVTAVAVDGNDASGNTVYVGTSGGGIWKSKNAAGPLGAVSFEPLTDTLPVFATDVANDGIGSLSIGALAVQPTANPVVLAGTGDSNDATDSYYGEGILRSSDAGLTWTVVRGSKDGAAGSHSFAGLSVAGLAWSTASPALVVAAISTSAKGSVVGAGNASSVAGLYFSVDAGVTWKMATVYDGATVVQEPLLSVMDGIAATSVVWNPVRQRFYTALRQHGFYESADGATWNRMASQPGLGLSTTSCPALTQGAGCPLFRGVLAVEPATGDLYALSVDAANNDNGLWQDLCNFIGTGCAASAPVFAHRVDAGAMDSVGNVLAQGTYDLALSAVSSGSETLLLAGAVDVYRCKIAAGSSTCTLRNTTNAVNGCSTPAKVSGAQHALAGVARSGGDPLVFVGNDGGLWRSLDGIAQSGAACSAGDAQHFENLNGALGSLAEVVGMAQHPTDANTLLVGLGANGSAATTAAASAWSARTAWMQLSSGEGGLPLLDAAAPANWYVSTAVGVSLKQCTLGSACTAASFAGVPTIGQTQVAGDAALPDPPVLLDPTLQTNVILGTCRVWRGAASGVGWSAANAISKPFGSGNAPCTSASPLVRSVAAGGPVAVAPGGANAGATVLYAGMAGAANGGSIRGHVFMTTAGATATSTTAWTDVGLSKVTNDSANSSVFNPNGFDISSVTVDAHDATGATVYATVMGIGSARVYRSTDFGAHWLNMTANLPDAPANALAIDPNDANTVYVALDGGVYATKNVTNCATMKCWSVMGTALPNSPVTALAAAANVLTGDGRTGVLRAGTHGRGVWSIPLLSAISVQPAAMTLSATEFRFPLQTVSTASATQTLTVKSTGSPPLVIASVNVSGDFRETDTCVGRTIAVGDTCALQLQFLPSAAGVRDGLLTIYANVAGGQAVAVLSGTGDAVVSSAISLSPSQLTFGAVVVNQVSAAQLLRIENAGTAAVALQTPVVTGEFALDGSSCGATLGPQTGCSFSVVFKPLTNGARSGALTINADGRAYTATLIGTGNAPATDTLSVTTLSFGITQIGSASATQAVVLTNAGDVALTLVSAAIASGPFTVAGDCTSALPAHASCNVRVAFLPTVAGAAMGVLRVSDQFRSQTVALDGIGVAPPGVSLTPVAGLSFASTGVGLSSAAQTIALTNNGGSTLTISSSTTSGDFHIASSTCGAAVASGASCTLQVIFAPTVGGARTGALTIVDNGPGGSQAVALSGAGVDFALAATGASSVTVVSGASAAFPMAITSASGVSGTAALSCSGAPANSVCTVAPGNVALGGTASVIATVQTGVVRAGIGQKPLSYRPALVMMALLVPVGLLGLRRRRALLLVALLVVTAGCGTARDIPGSGTGPAPNPTPAGGYAITVTAVSAGVSRSVGFTLVVQ